MLVRECSSYCCKNVSGDWVGDQRFGFGVMLYGRKASYEGEWLRGQRNGWGRMVYSTGDYYEGEWVAGVREGEGVLVYSTGTVYEGERKGDMREGRGRYTHISGVIQEGFWVADGLRCSVLSKKGDTKREKEEEEVEGGKASQTIPLYAYVDICDSGLLPHIRLKDYKAVLMEGRMDLKQG